MITSKGIGTYSPNKKFFTFPKARAMAGKYRARRMAMMTTTHRSSTREIARRARWRDRFIVV